MWGEYCCSCGQKTSFKVSNLNMFSYQLNHKNPNGYVSWCLWFPQTTPQLSCRTDIVGEFSVEDTGPRGKQPPLCLRTGNRVCKRIVLTLIVLPFTSTHFVFALQFSDRMKKWNFSLPNVRTWTETFVWLWMCFVSKHLSKCVICISWRFVVLWEMLVNCFFFFFLVITALFL